MYAVGTAALLVALVAAGCGSSGGTTLESLWQQPGENVGLVPGTSDYATGSIRVSFLVIGLDGRPVNRPEARLWLARSREAKPFASATASLESIGIPGAATDPGDVTHLYVGRFRLAKPGRYWLLAQPVGGTPIQALGTVDVRSRSHSPAIGFYRGNDPQNGLNRWVREWRLPSESWTFAVGRDGRIKAKFEGSVSAGELTEAVRILLER